MKKMFVLSALVLLSISNSNAQQYSSYAVCEAKVPCYTTDYYGRRVTGEAYCKTFGSSHVYGYGNTSASCTWHGVFGVGVRCTGFSQTQNQYGQVAWSWVDIPVNCPTR